MDTPHATRQQHISDANQLLQQFEQTGCNNEHLLLLRACLEYLPDEGKYNLANDLSHATRPTDLEAIAENLESALLLPLKARTRTPSGTPSPGREWDDEAPSTLSPDVKSEQATIKEKCLERDGHRCVISGIFERSWAIEHLPEESWQNHSSETVLAHIIPFCFGNSNSKNESKNSEIWEAMHHYFPSVPASAQLNAENINKPSNCMTLYKLLRDEFDKFTLYLEPTALQDVDNKYRVKTTKTVDFVARSLLPESGFVTLTAHSAAELPHPELLKCHAAVAKILYASGRGEKIEEILQELVSIQCVAEDGSTDLSSLVAVSLAAG
ncbi:hypothetical protein PRK78_006778 [Emydomyces testavorans]|uniref:HNH nuclease domain-containing protein n=1 Tax=Emydomyces testavorans TaxID=2070801 RepID=A0AAF0IL37_9EURO|nr:hypothetical protein PRK78_006778 [Emydomyces testavorans]